MASKHPFSEEDRTVCRICGHRFEHLGSHIFHKHNIRANAYKERFGFPHNLSLISSAVEAKKKERFEEQKEKYLANLHIGNNPFSFKKGHKLYDGVYKSASAIQNSTKRIMEVNNSRKWENCPVCNKKYLNLDVHLRLKHRLKRI